MTTKNREEPPDPHGVQCFDPKRYSTMANAIGESMGEIANEFLDACTGNASILGGLAATGNTAGFREICHEVKGAAAMLGFTGLASQAGAWEDLAAAGNLPTGNIPAVILQLVDATSRAMIAEFPDAGCS